MRFDVTGATAVPWLFSLLILAGCDSSSERGEQAAGSSASPDPVATVQEVFLSADDPESNLDSLAFWTNGARHWVLGTSKDRHQIPVFDATTGAAILTHGEPGNAAGQFARPNGIATIGDLALVVERDNHRVQVLRLPSLETALLFGSETLRRPYGIALRQDRAGEPVDVFVTDNFEGPEDATGEATPPPHEELDQRIVHFRMSATGDAAELVAKFGDTAGPGRLDKAESIALAPDDGDVLLAEELEGEQALLEYSPDGGFQRIVAEGLFEREPEGLAPYRCPGGFLWVLTDQQLERTVFHLAAPETFERLFSFAGATVAHTDGIATTETPLPGHPLGMFWAVHDDRSFGGFDWQTILEKAAIDPATCRTR